MLLLGLILVLGCESREEKYIRLQKKVASLRSEVDSILARRRAIYGKNRRPERRPELGSSLKKLEVNWVSDSELVKQIELEAENGNAMNEDEIQNGVTQLINDWSGGRKSAMTTYELESLEISVAAELTNYQVALLLYHKRQRESEAIPIERKRQMEIERERQMERLDSRAAELRKEIEELDLLINAMEKTQESFASVGYIPQRSAVSFYRDIVFHSSNNHPLKCWQTALILLSLIDSR